MHFLRRLPQRLPHHRQSSSPFRFCHFIDHSRLCAEFNDSALDFQRKILERSGDMLFNNTSVKPKDVGIPVINCSLFNPTPSLSAMIVNRYKLRGNIRSFNLGGMAIRNWYFENKKSMLIPNCLFRVDGVPVQGPDEEGASDLADCDLVR